MANSFIQNFLNAENDAIAFSDFIYKPAGALVERRLAPDMNTLNYYLEYLEGLKKVYSQELGYVDVNGDKTKTVNQAVLDAINSAGVENGLADTLVVATAKNGGVSRTQADKNADRSHVKDFGVIGDGIADDTQALIRAIESNVLLDFGNVVCRHTGIDAVAERLNWTANGAKFIYDGDYQKNAFSVRLDSDSYLNGAYEFDANSKCHASINLYTDNDISNRPELFIDTLTSRNVYRQSKAFTGGDGVYIAGGFLNFSANLINISDCYMAVGADIELSQGIFGLTVASHNGKTAKNIHIKSLRVKNVWSEDPNYKNDQDGVRIFQDLLDRESSCIIDNYRCINVANRAVKFHSSLNAKLGKVHRVLDSSVIPQSGDFSNADIDGQQSGISVDSFDFVYKGAYHSTLLQSYHDTRYNDVVVSNVGSVSGVFDNFTTLPTNVVVLALKPTAEHSNYMSTIDKVTIIGTNIDAVISANLRSDAVAVVNISDVRAGISNAVIKVLGSTTSSIFGTVKGVVNTGSTSIPMLSKFPNTTLIQDIGCIGVSDITLMKNKDGVGVNGKPKVTLDVYAATDGGQQIRLNGSKNLSTADSNYVGWYEWYHQVNNKRLGLIGYRGASNDLTIANELDGKIHLRVNGYSQLEVSRYEISLKSDRVYMVNIPNSPAGLTTGSIWRDGTTLKIV